ncbi:MAG: hypothetical protein AABY16_03175 [Nanoarchaeota archaeon]
MLDTQVFARHLAGYLRECGIIDCSEENFVYGSVQKYFFLGFYINFAVTSCDSTRRLDIFLGGSGLGDSFCEFISNNGGFIREPGLESILKELSQRAVSRCRLF